MVTGEAAKSVVRLDSELEERAPNAWKQFRDACNLRKIPTDEYFRVDSAVVWEGFKKNLSSLYTLIEPMLD